MDSNETSQGVTERPAENAQMSLFQRLGGVFLEPKKTFEDINRKPTWVALFVIFSLLGVGGYFLMTTRMGPELTFRKSLQMNPMTRKMPEDQIQQLWERQQNSAMTKYSKYIAVLTTPVAILATYAVFAAVFLVAQMLVGASVKYKKSMAVTYWAYFPAGLVGSILGAILAYVKEPEDLEMDLPGNVASNLGLLASRQEQPVLHSLLGSIDIFSAWTIFLLALGFAAVSDRKVTTGKAATGVLIIWILWILGKMGFTALFS